MTSRSSCSTTSAGSINNSRTRIGGSATAVTASNTTVTDIFGIGSTIAATLIEFCADIDRFANRDAYATDNATRAIVVSASGARASLAALTLTNMRYVDVAVLDGELKGWTDAGLPTNEHEYSGI